MPRPLVILKRMRGATVPTSPKPSLWSYIPPWIANNIRSPKSRKVLFRCWLASWAAYILILPHNTLKVMGNAAYFGFLASQFLPPYIPIQLFLIAISTMMIGVLMGWGFGAAGMRVGLAVRNQVFLQSQLEKDQKIAYANSNPDAAFKIEVFNGDFLEWQSTLVFGATLALGNFIFALMRAYSRPLIFASIFGTISLDIFCCVGPLYPFANYYIVNTLSIPISMYIAISCVVIICVFPETVNHAFMDAVSALLSKIEFMVQGQERVLSAEVEDFVTEHEIVAQLRANRTAMFTIYEGIKLQSKFINIEFSFGRWNGDDNNGLVSPLLSVISRINGLMTFLKYVASGSGVDVGEKSAPGPELDGKGSKDTYLIQQVYNRNNTAEKELSLGLLDVLPTLKEATASLRHAAVDGIAAVRKMIDCLNHHRYTWIRSQARSDALYSEHVELLDHATDNLRTALEEFKADKRLRLLDPYRSHLEAAETHKDQAKLPLRGLYVSYVFSATFIGVAEAILVLMELVRATNATKRSKNRLWAPSGLRHIAHALFIDKRGRNDGREFGEQDVVEQVVSAEPEEVDYRRDPDSSRPSNAFQRAMHVVHRLYKWTKTAEALFVFRYVLISILMWMPAAFRTSAPFFYRQKGVWALIMAQTTVTIYTGDQLYNYIIRLTGTALGLGYGLLIWYVGNGNGDGSPYGQAASVAVFAVPLQFIRLFAPPQYLQGVILFNATVALINGFSWIDGHLPVISDPGIGWPVAWRRWTLVMIGCAASFILMLFPPKSGRKHVRLFNAKTLTSLGNIYALLMSTWIAQEETDEKGEVSEKTPLSAQSPAWANSFREKMIKVALQVQHVKEQAALARWEGNFRGNWAAEEYDRIIMLQEQMIAVLAQLGGALSKLDPGWRTAFLNHTKVVNPNFMAEVLSVFSLVAQALRTGEPIHTALPQNLMDRLLYHYTAVYLNPRHDGLIRIDEIESLDYLYYAAAVIAVLQLMEILDELQAIMRRLCGEVPFQGFERWKDAHQRAHAVHFGA
ncbi:hypothetical protein FA95DRAFT_677065 [Auriscalpium vulgare]|uniref:Uncharacterized protein n=1 Tax=Auriscalpium vulgare TaxID=40419 RepID=A0ACB8RBZ6_9AGAM|nr:hypothetical protein FA95DRAFT_677065 [Auriscalpium vulgare]